MAWTSHHRRSLVTLDAPVAILPPLASAATVNFTPMGANRMLPKGEKMTERDLESYIKECGALKVIIHTTKPKIEQA